MVTLCSQRGGNAVIWDNDCIMSCDLNEFALVIVSSSESGEAHVRYDHIYLTGGNSQSEMEYSEIKRPRLDMGAEPLMRHPPQRPPMPLAGAEDAVKVSDLERKKCQKGNEPTEEENLANEK
ncbi:nuclear receptor corepressor 2 isoform X1 [Tachysurus ichikawai]